MHPMLTKPLAPRALPRTRSSSNTWFFEASKLPVRIETEVGPNFYFDFPEQIGKMYQFPPAVESLQRYLGSRYFPLHQNRIPRQRFS